MSRVLYYSWYTGRQAAALGRVLVTIMEGVDLSKGDQGTGRKTPGGTQIIDCRNVRLFRLLFVCFSSCSEFKNGYCLV